MGVVKKKFTLPPITSVTGTVPVQLSMKSDSPLVTAIIPAYNRPERTKRAVKSVVDQSYEPIEVILVDDDSTPPLEDSVFPEHSSLTNSQIITHETNRGANAARNTGIDAASGEYLAFLDSDDEWAPDKIAKQVTKFYDSPATVGAVYTGVRQIDPNGKINSVSCPGIRGKVSKNLLLGNFIGTFSSLMVRSSVFETVDELDPQFPSWQDWEFYLRLSQEYEFEVVKEPLVNRHIDGEQISDDFHRKQRETVPAFREKFEPLAASHGKLFRRKWRGYLAYHIARAALGNRLYIEGRQWLLQSIRWYPLIPHVYVHLLFSLLGGQTYEFARQVKRIVIRVLERY